MRVVGVIRSLLFLAEVELYPQKFLKHIWHWYCWIMKDDLGISANLAKTIIKSCATCVSHTFLHETTSTRWVCVCSGSKPDQDSQLDQAEKMDQLALRRSPFCQNVLRHASVDTWVGGFAWYCVRYALAHLLLSLSSPDSKQNVSFMVG